MLDVVHITIYIDSIYRLQLDSVSGAYKKKNLVWDECFQFGNI